MQKKIISGRGMGECYLKDDFITCVIDDKKIEGAWSVVFEGLRVGWHSPGVSPTGNLVTFHEPSMREIGCYFAEDEMTIKCYPKSRLEPSLGKKID